MTAAPGGWLGTSAAAGAFILAILTMAVVLAVIQGGSP